MRFCLFSFALIILNCMDYSQCQGNRWRRNKRASYVSNPTCKGCLSCSKDNGCSRCQQKLFFFLRREGMRQYGECLHSCPSGYYGHRAPDMNRCARCRIENCDSCFSKDFCTKCKAGFYLHRGRCFDECPDGFAPLDETMECVEGCEVGHWSEWGPCSRNNRTCGFKWGLETRTRQIVKKPAKDTIPCPTIAESRRCKMAVRHCPGDLFNICMDFPPVGASLNLIALKRSLSPFHTGAQTHYNQLLLIRERLRVSITEWLLSA
ncbi:R-spondin-2 isoform X3 [Mesocricetus auratus]|uniref:R-spondin-2 isoform X3 n=1 Tax=Mesocricetus auratus TaxID=10036 RepID=A0A3Q0CUL5_MESAU|nr:R-spondin-2 isoform X3 [Mesocricetus auratus]